mgnify:FL=1
MPLTSRVDGAEHLKTGGVMAEKLNNQTEEIRIGQVRDVNNKEVFKNHVLCAQFLRDYAGLDILANVQPEDIEDVTDRYHMFKQGFSISADISGRVL